MKAEKKVVQTKTSEARKVQEDLRTRVITEDCLGTVRHVAGCDVSCRRFSYIVHAGVALLSKENWKQMCASSATAATNFPYIPGFLSFREIPILVQAFERLMPKPDLIYVDGQGISHPRGLGIAAHLGVLLDIPTIGVAKSVLVGKPAGTLGTLPGDTVELVYQDRTVGLMLRTKKGANPIIVSIGHKISLQTALNLVLESLKGYRLPEPTRLAHIAANQERMSYVP